MSNSADSDKLSSVDDQENLELAVPKHSDNGEPAEEVKSVPSTPKRGMNVNLALQVKNNRYSASLSPGVNEDLPMPDKLLHKLATKKHHIQELKSQLAQAEAELKELEEAVVRHVGRSRDTPKRSEHNEPTQDFKTLIQKKLQSIDSSPAVVKSQKFISNLFSDMNSAHSAKAEESAPKPSTVGNNKGVSGFLNKMKTRFQEFSFDGEEENDFDEGRKDLNRFHLSDKYEYDSDEEIPIEEVDHKFASVPKDTYKRLGFRNL
ncbi:HHR219Cp [Eremothecium sinecaudum]|uniref:HHR219Cp n=1 Tax=Eremothecium sinecaudum TaxID=45286 RepID=A0A0X8HX38_9SACH|nr:HHR219Cp [Eremothecium sinecaudum]AMD22988.1 HHR219Cp [Eremothecium sinecaudum]